LAQLGIQVDEEIVRLVRFEMLREISRARVDKPAQAGPVAGGAGPAEGISEGVSERGQ
jgi:hypothetical protein